MRARLPDPLSRWRLCTARGELHTGRATIRGRYRCRRSCMHTHIPLTVGVRWRIRLTGVCLLVGCLLGSEVAAQGSRSLLAAKQRYEDRDQGTRIVRGDDTTYARNPWQVA